jgi:hydroxymethylbilane synthase
MANILKIGTRGSPLALIQANDVRDRLRAAHDGLEVEIIVIRTTGDRIQDRPLADIGGKGLFIKEIEEALFSGDIDLAVHSMKDVETQLPEGLGIAVILPREDPRDAFISNRAASLSELPSGATVGTSSLRRQAQIRHARPDLRVVSFRGNVETRLRKLNEGEADATLLAISGLRRLGMADVATQIMDVDEMLPAVAQGAVGVEARVNDKTALDYLRPLNDAASVRRVAAERALLAALDGSCRTPIAALAQFDGTDILTLRGRVANIDGTVVHDVARRGPASEAEAMGDDAGRELRAVAGPNFFV